MTHCLPLILSVYTHIRGFKDNDDWPNFIKINKSLAAAFKLNYLQTNYYFYSCMKFDAWEIVFQSYGENRNQLGIIKFHLGLIER